MADHEAEHEGNPRSEVTRRTLTTGALFGALAIGTNIFRIAEASSAAAPAGSAAGAGAPAGPHWGLTKFLDPLRVPPVIRPRERDLEVRTSRTEVRLHSQLPPTAVWAFNGQFPGPTIDVRSGRPLRVEWINDIDGHMPLVAVQAPAPANPTNSPGYRDTSGAPLTNHTIIEGVAELPPWTVTHLHGAPNDGGSDGWPHNGMLKGSSQLVQYRNRQPSTALFYHDHAMAITRYTIHTGLTGMYLIRDDEENALGLPSGPREIPLLLCDRNLDTVPATGELTGQLLFKIPAVPYDGALVPAGFTGPFNTVNGTIWPHLDVQAQWYRFRLLNVSNGRIYTLNLVDDTGQVHNDAISVIGTDGGLLPAPAPVPAGGLNLAPAERLDVLVDFSRLKSMNLRLTDARTAAGPTEPDLMQFRVANRSVNDAFKLPAKLSPSYVRVVPGSVLPADHDEVWVGLVMSKKGHPEMWELDEVDTDMGDRGVIQIVDPVSGAIRTFRKRDSMFDDTVGIYINHGRWAVWNFIHVGPLGPVHPMHIHLARFQALFRRNFTTTWDLPTERTTKPISGFTADPLAKHEEGWKDTFLVNRGQWVAVAGKFEGGTGEYVYHCHVGDHEDDGMMRPFVVHPPEVAKFHEHSGDGMVM
ncbi:MAG TPA: multicopper oxidase domain-containing protein [Amycolatopsis sp.]|uniref:multicopper oxidase family protein n=1 Tax=Amycolatopsis sp. TaxID=37632 RepID=UPI002B48B3B2|nr:multicopper oxidase domain-containing protein [Amycolatopsis sp.]HKS44414.1 multicopper oxidase domain-containing protein [Amycolatopsis sp.]